MEVYRHTQIGYVGPVGFMILAAVFAAVLTGAGPSPSQLLGFAVFFALLAAMLLNFSRLTVRLDDGEREDEVVGYALAKSLSCTQSQG